MTHTLTTVTPSRDGNALLALTIILMLTTWSFFGRFSLAAAAAGIGTALWLHRWYVRHPTSPARSPDRRPPMLNISSVYVGGDAAGLSFVVGTVVVFVMGLPPLRWFALTSAALAVACAVTIVTWRRTHMWSSPETSLRA